MIINELRITKFTRDFYIQPAYDFRANAPNYGAHGCELRFAVIAEPGAVSLTIYTDWFPESLGDVPIKYEKPWVTDVGFHSRTERDGTRIKKCQLLNSPCWYDGTSLNEPWQRGIIHGGSDWLWPRLEELWRHYFEDAKYPDLNIEPQKPPKSL